MCEHLLYFLILCKTEVYCWKMINGCWKYVFQSLKIHYVENGGLKICCTALVLLIKKFSASVFYFELYAIYRQFHQHFTRTFFVRTSFLYVRVTRKKLPKRRSYEKFVRINVDEIDTWFAFVMIFFCVKNCLWKGI